MSDRITQITSPKGHGLQEWGRKTRAQMIAQYRAHYQRELESAREALSATDDELVVETFLGPYAQKRRETVHD